MWLSTSSRGRDWLRVFEKIVPGPYLWEARYAYREKIIRAEAQNQLRILDISIEHNNDHGYAFFLTPVLKVVVPKIFTPVPVRLRITTTGTALRTDAKQPGATYQHEVDVFEFYPPPKFNDRARSQNSDISSHTPFPIRNARENSTHSWVKISLGDAPI